MQLISIYANPVPAFALLFDLLRERKPEESISHKRMPSWDEHCAFVSSKPYRHWYAIDVGGSYVGAIYLTRGGEIGISILQRERRRGYAAAAIRLLMATHPGRHLANINPANGKSLALFRSLGFSGPVQITLERANA